MSPILQNLVEMTGHRDHLRLEVSVLSTLQGLAGTLEVRALEIFTVDGVQCVRPRTWLEHGHWTSGTMEAAHDPQRQPLAELPELQACIANREDSAKAKLGENRYRLWLPVWMQDKVSSCLEITQSQPHLGPETGRTDRDFSGLPQLPEFAGLQRARRAHGPAQPQDL